MKRHLANVLTLSRLAMAAAIFVLLYHYDARHPQPALLDASVALFILAGLTDVLDGAVARRLGTATKFGRLADPFIDKVLICGTFIMLCGPGFAVMGAEGRMVIASGIAPWMAVLIVVREVLVNSLRGVSEQSGRRFNATIFGKLKMTLQSLTLLWLFLQLGHGDGWGRWSLTVRDVMIWTTLVFTALSALVYLPRARRLLDDDEGGDA